VVDATLADVAAGRLDRVLVDDLEAMAAREETVGGPFDAIVAADVLEHLRDPWAVVRWASGLVAPGGVMVVSLPNVRHLQTLWSVGVRGRWRYEGMGLFDRTHLRWFARGNVPELFHGTDLRVRTVTRVPLLSIRPGSPWNRFAPLLGDLGALQLLVVADKPPS
jgi:2-polyprenyl-3-methyl-5-hydroxy-6-metoxy-1,4-benzoquinol methylase